MPRLLSLLDPMALVFERVQGLKSTGNSCICYEESRVGFDLQDGLVKIHMQVESTFFGLSAARCLA